MRRIRCNILKSQETPENIANKVLCFLKGLKLIDEIMFSDWFQQGWSKKEALSKKVSFENHYILDIVNDNWDKKFPNLGTNFAFWTGKDNNLLDSVASFSLGKTIQNPSLHNVISLRLPEEENSINIDEEKIEEIINLLKSIWKEQIIEVLCFL